MSLVAVLYRGQPAGWFQRPQPPTLAIVSVNTTSEVVRHARLDPAEYPHLTRTGVPSAAETAALTNTLHQWRYRRVGDFTRDHHDPDVHSAGIHPAHPRTRTRA